MSGQRYSGTQPPEHGEDRTDPWGWLYREDGQIEPVERQAPALAPTEAYDPMASMHDHLPPDVQPRHAKPIDEPAQQPAGSGYGYGPPSEIPEYHPTPAGEPAAGLTPHPNPDADTDTGESILPRRGRGPMIAVIVGALALVLIIAGVLVALSLSQSTSRTPDDGSGSQPPASGAPSASSPQSPQSPQSSQSSQPSPSGEGAYTGPVDPITATGATADCVAADATDGNGDRVSYAAALAVDSDLDSAWRCDGDGVGETLRVTLPEGSSVARLGLLNGYAKVDPATGDRRYPEYRRITTVRWELSNGTTVEQKLADKTEASQAVSIPVQRDVEWVQVTILTSTAPGSNATTRDAVLISEIAVFAPA